MNAVINGNLSQVIVLDISGIYAQIYDQGYYNEDEILDIKQEYSDAQHWRVVVLDN